MNETDSLLKELENLNQTLTNELRREINTVNTTDTVVASTVSTNFAENSTTELSPVSANPPVSTFVPFKLNDDNLSEFILENSQKLIKHSLETVESLKYIVAGTADGDTMSGYSAIIKATSSALDTLNSINIQKQKDKTAKEIKAMDIDGRKQITSAQKPNQTLNIMAPRETIMKMLDDFENKKQLSPPIDAEFEEITPKSPKTAKNSQSQPV